mmetsp:Transcript_92077/g.298073  ORF Transcript_92077/g.298073 Transcript_92077/m.298073 type:complete len:132 (-) Transcript_92077:233-628(-)
MLGAFAGMAVSQTSVMLSHTLQFALLLAMCTNLTQYTLYLCWQRHRWPQSTLHARFGPVYIVTAATTFVMVQPTYLVLRVAKQVQAMNSPWGHIMHACTIIGYFLLFLGMLWATDAWLKIKPMLGLREHDL